MTLTVEQDSDMSHFLQPQQACLGLCPAACNPEVGLRSPRGLWRKRMGGGCKGQHEMACTGNEGCHDAADEVAGAPSSLRHNTTDGRLSVDLITKSRQRRAPRKNLQDPRPQETKA